MWELFEYTGCDKGTRQFLKRIMLAVPRNAMSGTIPLASLTDAVVVTLEQWSAQHIAFIVETF
jgi:hypothetical protein